MLSGRDNEQQHKRTEPDDGSAVPWSWLKSGEGEPWHRPLLTCYAMAAAAGLRALFSELHLRRAGIVGPHYSVPEAIL